MKKISMMLFIMSVFMIIGISGAQAVTPVSGVLSITNLQTSPSTVMSGENLTLSFNVYNSYSHTVYDTNLQLISQNPMLNVSPTDNYLVSDIGPGSYNLFGKFYYNVTIPKTLPQGEYTINVVANYRSNAPVSPGFTVSEPGESTMPIYIYVYGKPKLNLNINPVNPVIPGSYNTFEISAINTGTGPAYNVSVTLHNSKYLNFSGNNVIYLNSITNSGSMEAQDVAYMHNGIKAGIYYVNATLNYRNSLDKNITRNISIPVNVIINKPKIKVSVESSTPSILYPGSNQTINLLVQNIGSGTAKNITISLLGNSNTTYGSVSSFSISELPSQKSSIETAYVQLNKDYTGSSIKIPVNVSYTNSNEMNNQSKIEDINLSIQKAAIFEVTNVSDKLIPGSTYSPVTFTIKNIGDEEAQEAVISLQSIYPITPVDSNAYISKIMPNQSENVTFYVSIDSKANFGSYPITLYEQWIQPNSGESQEFSSVNNYYLLISKTNSNGLNNYYDYIVILIILIIIIYLYRKFKNKSKTKNSKGIK